MILRTNFDFDFFGYDLKLSSLGSGAQPIGLVHFTYWFCFPFITVRLVRGLDPWIGLATLVSLLFGNILFLRVIYSHETTNLIHTGLAKPLKNK
jgi:hypothetical protein